MSKPVLFVSFRPLSRAENLRAIYEYYDGPKVHMLTSDPNYRQEVRSGKYDLMVIDEFTDITPGKCIMIWHGIQGGKTIGLDQPGKPLYCPEWADNMTYIISASHDMVPVWNKCTGVPSDRILPLGMPRTDEYVGKHKGDGHTQLAHFRSYLYAPTFRDTDEPSLPDIDWNFIDRHMYDDEILAIKLHPWYVNHGNVSLDISGCRHIIVLPEGVPSAPYLYDADVVITDYSSIMFDAYFLNKPVVLFEKNPGYIQTRGMYMDYPIQYSSRFAITEEGMINMMRSANSLTQIEKTCLNFVADVCDGHACERLCKLIHTLNGGELP